MNNNVEGKVIRDCIHGDIFFNNKFENNRYSLISKA